MVDVESPATDVPTGDGVHDLGDGKGPWPMRIRIAVFVVCFLVAGVGFAAGVDMSDELDTTGKLVEGFIFAAIAYAVLGLLNWWRHHRKQSERGYARATMSYGIMLIVTLIAISSGASKEFRQDEQANGEAAAAVGGDSELEQQREDYVQWFTAMVDTMETSAAASYGHAALLDYSNSKNATQEGMLARLPQDRRRFVDLREAFAGFPAPSAEYEQLNGELRRAVAGFIRADDLYVRAYSSPAGKKGDELLTAGDAAYDRASRQYQAVANAGDEIYARLGGNTFGRRLGLDELQNKAERIRNKYEEQ